MEKSTIYLVPLMIILWILGACSPNGDKSDLRGRPNVIFILTDDQGYGDLACHGNPWINTPNLDTLYSESIRFTNFHTGTTCAPTRAGLLSGQYCNKVGAWHTVMGREFLKAGEPTLADMFKSAGYTTGIFGKWHLGDNYPYRPQDRGFDEVLIHGGGGVGQAPDFWNNDYFGDTYVHNGQPEKVEGYCTDVWFEHALNFIENSKGTPFFAYLSTNAPHSPYHVPERYSDYYQGNPQIPNPYFYGMITNLDENIGRLRRKLTELGIAENTILVFMTDNGTAAGVTFDHEGKVKAGYNAGMRGKKGSNYEGGHRVPFFLHWPAGGINEGRDISQLSSYVDVMPTLLDMSGVAISDNGSTDGISLKPVIYDENQQQSDRVIFTDTQREDFLVKWKQPSVMKGPWRLQGQSELYHVEQDPGQLNNVAAQHPEIVNELKAAYEKWWEKISVNADEYNYIPIGASDTSEVSLSSHDTHTEKGIPVWSQYDVREAPDEAPVGTWAIEIFEAGIYNFELRRWPKESNLKITASAPSGDSIQGITAPFPKGKSLNISKVSINMGGEVAEKSVSKDDVSKEFQFDLKKGHLHFSAKFVDAMDQEWGVYYAYIRRVK